MASRRRNERARGLEDWRAFGAWKDSAGLAQAWRVAVIPSVAEGRRWPTLRREEWRFFVDIGSFVNGMKVFSRAAASPCRIIVLHGSFALSPLVGELNSRCCQNLNPTLQGYKAFVSGQLELRQGKMHLSVLWWLVMCCTQIIRHRLL
ncbi:hypothetical protein HID58_069512 [Brassica napus]|uniref:Uncharacterized protein n=1 Tax=Brassica napus TaxID=3708 RepID=A0ABQ7YW61_BRANA|nr:hypothetical protein HID58_069512 [Brassica napus]